MRTDNDSWDITTSVGSTAVMVAAARALEAAKPNPLAVDQYAEVFTRAVGGDWAGVLDGEAPQHPLATAEFGVPFINFQGARTKYFDAYFRSVMAAGVRQIVLLAAGLDSRAYRLDWPDGTTIYELDQPRVLEFKREVLADNGAEPKAHRREIAVDLRDDWRAALTGAGFDPAQPSAWIAEGLLIYLPATAQDQLFTGIDALAAPGSWVAVEEGEPMPDEVFAAKRAEGDEMSEGFFKLIYNEQIAPAAEWFGSRGWRAEATGLADYFRTVGRPVPTNPEAAAMIASNSLVTAIKG
ncbi:class I SAM-dependent methyltransferase [Mycobacterium sp. CBMA293]|uniref:class I SAM-dependent methyltransferase n=2 Tax=Mycolicibacterium TaxID=1866885 RepID=UPI001325D5B8|nr:MULTISPECIES: class I SAM-dependent methyltransferase [unclassified Mycolicibacterium]MUL47910.1 class I SAM-dependent methyltransferase [Mycolicibacterium sp. CBMA 360]MUL94610.1 class I SAM-dependent methyltransferase [Mycolicibacterium sp. CBMA 230]MUL59242.1 class I SAM-dependent methyltransferase [Mycolicibacterium sp. CBMA 335]MUL70967.1 class I SAM-dependent methyltransferase [Mycolicibacterium sp. CBMA 311]MUM09212.1 SAM-dependent methyltransferase [Mycolicibacterium sp. CBMA 213]